MVFTINRKRKGSVAERFLIKKFWENDWAAFRAAGSGSARHPCPDIIAGNSLRKVAIEVKVTSDVRKYFPAQEINDLRQFSHVFGSEGWIAIKFNSHAWFFFSLEDLKETQAGYVITVKDVELKGFSFEDFLKI
ncbi:MAG: Holliday junction resolvase Hjc [Candidatus Woesearchaeota archaeon]